MTPAILILERKRKAEYKNLRISMDINGGASQIIGEATPQNYTGSLLSEIDILPVLICEFNTIMIKVLKMMHLFLQKS